MTYLILAETGEPLDASIDLASDSVILHSRGGGGRNPDYGRALRLILQRLRSSQMPIVRVFVDSERVQNMTIEERIVLNGNELRSQEADPFTLISVRAAAVGQTLGTKGGNPTKKLRFQFSEGFSEEDFCTSGVPPLKWSTHWDMTIPLFGGPEDGWKAREAGRHCFEASAG